MPASDFTREQRREYLRAIFANPRGKRLHELIDVAVHAFGGDLSAAEATDTYEFRVPPREHATELQRVAG